MYIFVLDPRSAGIDTRLDMLRRQSSISVIPAANIATVREIGVSRRDRVMVGEVISSASEPIALSGAFPLSEMVVRCRVAGLSDSESTSLSLYNKIVQIQSQL